jgi:hypothetical protein
MRVLIKGSGTFKNSRASKIARQCLERGDEVHFLREEGSESPFVREFNLTEKPATSDFLNEIADFHNFCEKCRSRYSETIYDPNWNYDSTYNRIRREFGPERIIEHDGHESYVSNQIRVKRSNEIYLQMKKARSE